MGCCLSTYDEFDYYKRKSELKTGDLVLFSGKGGMSCLIKTGTFSPWSHVGIIIRTRTDFEGFTSSDNLYLFHAYKEHLGPDVFSGENKSGVQLNRLGDALRRYIRSGGVPCIRKGPPYLSIERGSLPSVSIDPFENEDTKEWFRKKTELEYEESLYQLVSSQIDCCCLPCFQNYGDETSYFCSELTRRTLAYLYPYEYGLEEGEYPDEQTPNDQSTNVYCFWAEKKIDLEEWESEERVVF